MSSEVTKLPLREQLIMEFGTGSFRNASPEVQADVVMAYVNATSQSEDEPHTHEPGYACFGIPGCVQSQPSVTRDIEWTRAQPQDALRQRLDEIDANSVDDYPPFGRTIATQEVRELLLTSQAKGRVRVTDEMVERGRDVLGKGIFPKEMRAALEAALNV